MEAFVQKDLSQADILANNEEKLGYFDPKLGV